MINVGIDLGTTGAMIGYVDMYGVPTLAPDSSDPTVYATPAVVHIGPSGTFVGANAEALLEDEPGLPMVGFLRFTLGMEDVVYVDHLERSWSPERATALIIEKLKDDAESFLGEPLGSAVIATPAQFDHPQRKALKYASRLAGVEEARLVDEPIAAALFCGLASHERKLKALVYDLGGAVFDATVLNISPEEISVMGAGSSVNMGGKRFDEVIQDVAADQFRVMNDLDLVMDPAVSKQARKFAERVKMELSKAETQEVEHTLLLSNRILDFLITREQFETLIDPLLDETVAICEDLMEECEIGWNDLDCVLLVGGSSLIPKVQAKIGEVSGKRREELIRRQPDQAIPFGAAMLAAQYSGTRRYTGARIYSSCSKRSLGIRYIDRRTRGVRIENVPENIDHKVASQRVQLADIDMSSNRVIFDVVKIVSTGEAPKSLETYEFEMAGDQSQNSSVHIDIGYDEDGLLNVMAYEPDSDQRLRPTDNTAVTLAPDFWSDL